MTEFKTPKEALREMHSSPNQDICGRLVDREVLACVSGEYSDLMRAFYETQDIGIDPYDFENLNRFEVDLSKFSGNIFEGSNCERIDRIDELREEYEDRQDRLAELTEKLEEIRGNLALDEELAETDDPAYSEEEKQEAAKAIPGWKKRIDAYNGAIFALSDMMDALLEDIDALEGAEDYQQEIFEYWIVSSWFAKKLDAEGEPVYYGFNNIWGRTCTGQAIKLDYVIGKIAADMEILDGQRNAWNAPPPKKRIEIEFYGGLFHAIDAPEDCEIYFRDLDETDEDTGEKGVWRNLTELP